MSDVSFDEEQTLTRYAAPAPTSGGIAGLLMRMGIAKNASQANMAMIAIIVVAVAIMAVIWFPSGSSTSSVQAPPTEIPGS